LKRQKNIFLWGFSRVQDQSLKACIKRIRRRVRRGGGIHALSRGNKRNVLRRGRLGDLRSSGGGETCGRVSTARGKGVFLLGFPVDTGRIN